LLPAFRRFFISVYSPETAWFIAIDVGVKKKYIFFLGENRPLKHNQGWGQKGGSPFATSESKALT